MPHEVTITYSEQIVRKGVWRFWSRFVGWWRLSLGLLCILTGGFLLPLGGWVWQAAILIVVGTLVVGMGAVVYFVFLRRALRKFERMGSKSVGYVFTDEQICMTSDMAESKASWKLIERIWRFPELWLIFMGASAYFTLPVEHISTATREFICAQVQRHGGKVR